MEQRAYKAFTDAVATAESINDQRALSYALGYMGELYEKAKRYDQAQQLTQQAVLAAQRVDAPAALYRWYWQTGRLLKAQGNAEAAITAYQNAVSILQTIRQDLTTGYGGAGVDSTRPARISAITSQCRCYGCVTSSWTKTEEGKRSRS
jgi:tetratricopeptide (TPR) repeat protein